MVYCVKSVLVVLTQQNQSDLSLNESISALMLFASFGIHISVLFKEAALSLLANTQHDEELKKFLKPANKMVDSFEFYDIENLYILTKDQQHPLVQNTQHTLVAIELNANFIAQFDHIITW